MKVAIVEVGWSYNDQDGKFNWQNVTGSVVDENNNKIGSVNVIISSEDAVLNVRPGQVYEMDFSNKPVTRPKPEAAQPVQES